MAARSSTMLVRGRFTVASGGSGHRLGLRHGRTALAELTVLPFGFVTAHWMVGLSRISHTAPQMHLSVFSHRSALSVYLAFLDHLGLAGSPEC